MITIWTSTSEGVGWVELRLFSWLPGKGKAPKALEAPRLDDAMRLMHLKGLYGPIGRR